MEYVVEVFRSYADDVLNEIATNNKILYTKPFKKFIEICGNVKKDNENLEPFIEYTRKVGANSGVKGAKFRAEEIIGLVTSTIPRMLSATQKLGIPMEIACEYENILANAERQRVSGGIAKSLFKNRDYITSMKYTAKEEGYKDSAQKGFYYMDAIDRAKFEEYLDLGVELSGNCNTAEFDPNVKPTSINVFAGNNKETFELMKDNINDMQDDFIFG